MARSEAIWSDGNGNLVAKKDATYLEVLEYDDAGHLVKVTEGSIRLDLPNSKMESGY